MSFILTLAGASLLALFLCAACAPGKVQAPSQNREAGPVAAGSEAQAETAQGADTGLDLVALAEKEVSGADWVKPLADAVMAVICSGAADGNMKTACLAYEAASAAVGAQVFLTREVLKKYKGDPTPMNATELKQVVENLKTKMLPVLKGYQGGF
ncbi:MAG: hypothetical protein LLG06_12385 [Desulfobacteraceae bacterium]|nr:hypothetical protein [Desulfobacteraceae bacterium]